MAVNFQDNEIELAWSEVFSKDEYRIAIAEIANKYPQPKSLHVDYADINAYNVDFAMFILDHPDRCLDLARKTFAVAYVDDSLFFFLVIRGLQPFR